MALFPRRRRNAGDEPEPDDTDAATAAAESASDEPSEDAAAPTSDEAVPQVGISLTSFRAGALPGGPAQPPAPQPEAAAPRTPTENALLRQALSALTPESTPVEAVSAARQLLQGTLYVRVKGDVAALTASRSSIPWAVTRDGDDTYVLVFSGRTAVAAAVEKDGDRDTSAVAFPALTLLARILAGEYTGIMVDAASPPARLTLKREFLERALAPADPQVALKTLLAGPRDATTSAAVGLAMKTAPLFVAVGTAAEGAAPGIAEARTEDGARLVQVFSHPLEVVATGRGDRPMPFTGEQLGQALRDDPGIGGVILDPLGPWMRLSREDLQPLIDG